MSGVLLGILIKCVKCGRIRLGATHSFPVRKRIVVKIGSGVIWRDGKFDARVVRHIVEQIVVLKQKGVEAILITSGAVATGRGMG